MNLYRSETDNAEIGNVSQTSIISTVRAVVALNSQGIGKLLSDTWAFSMAFDMGNKSNNSYLDVTLRFVHQGTLENIHLVVMPLNTKHTGDNMANAI